MKTIFTLLSCMASLFLFSQTQAHPTIDKLQASYKIVRSAVELNAHNSMNVTMHTSILLKPGTDVSRIYFKMSDEHNNVVYNVNYALNSPAVTNPKGILLFKKEGNTISINSPDTLVLVPYKYEIYTENGQGQPSLLFSVTQ